MTDDEIINRFKYHSSDETKIKLFEDIRLSFKRIALKINQLAPESREKALAITKLEEAQFWANASIARNENE